MRQVTAHFLALVFILASFLLFTHSASARGASLYLSPGSGSFYVGSTFDVSILLNTQDVSVNTIEVDLKFPKDKIQIANPSVGKSIIQIWATTPTFSNREGRVYFVGGVPSPGIKTTDGVVLTMTFRVVAPGAGDISFQGATRVLANDGSGTNILDQATLGRYTFSPIPPQGPQISSPTHPDQAKYYKNPSPTFIWTDNEGVEGFSYAFDQDPNGIPDASIDSKQASVSYDDYKDGIWYFHVRARQNGVWGGTSTFTVHIDTKPPAVFDIKVSPSERTTNTRPVARFFTTDSLSGFSHFEMKIVPLALDSGTEESLFFEVSSPHQFVAFKPGRYTVIVRAFDNAGNWRDEEVVLNIIGYFFQFISADGVDLIFTFVPWGRFLNLLLLLALFILMLLIIFWRRHHKHIHASIKEDLKRLVGIRPTLPASPQSFMTPAPISHRVENAHRQMQTLERAQILTEQMKVKHGSSILNTAPYPNPTKGVPDGQPSGVPIKEPTAKAPSFQDLRDALRDKESKHPDNT